ncbi:MAG: murein biosynthesis integral membrane protein MurJ [Ancrocorticia sp.]|uniref:murein biosynthesis integral membrane protein MurJ n=1 Tax=Ancrocorticia sp. TaxID=2593684 RepID=UPI003F907901
MNKAVATVTGAAGSIAILTLLSRLVGFVRTWVQNGALGDTLAGEAYSTSNTVPNVLFEVAAGGALAGAVIPLISGFLAKKMEKEASRTASALLTWIVAIGLPIAGIVVLAATPITTALLGRGTESDEVELAAGLLRMFALQIPLYGISLVCTGILQAHRRFILPALAPMLSAVTVIGALVIFWELAQGNQHDPEALSTASIMWLGWGTTLGTVAFSLPQLIPVMRLMKIRPTFAFPPGVAKRAVKLMGAGLGGILAQQVQIITIMVVANTYGAGDGGQTGAYPIYTFANAIYMVPYAVFAVPIATAVFPRLSEAAALPGRPGLAELTARSTRLVLEIGIMCVALLAALALPAKLVFDYLREASGLDVALIAMAPGLVGYALIYHCSRVLYALEASRAVVVVNMAAWFTVCIALGIQVLFGIEGRTQVLIAIGVAISIGMTIGAIGQLVAIRAALGSDAIAGLGRAALTVTCAAGVAGALGYAAVRGAVAWLGTGLIGAGAAVVVGGLLIVGGGGLAIYVTDRRALSMATRS